MTQLKHAAPTPNAPCNADHGVKNGDGTIMVSFEIDGSIFGNPRYYNRPIPDNEVEQHRRAWIMEWARDQRAQRKGRRRLNPSEAWRIEAVRARRMALEAVRVANSVSAPTGDWRREREAARPYLHAIHVAVRLLCRASCAWARARVLAHMAGDAAGLAYCTRGLHAAQAAPRPPTWCEDVGEMPPPQPDETMP